MYWLIPLLWLVICCLPLIAFCRGRAAAKRVSECVEWSSQETL